MSHTNDVPGQPPRKLSARNLAGSSADRPEADFYPTPPEAVLALLAEETFEGSIWENSCGDGAICRVLEEAGYRDLIATDLIDRGYGEAPHDFLTSTLTADNVVMNPPFSMAQQFVELSLARTTGKVAMLGKLVFLEGQKRKAFFAQTPLRTVYVFSKRVNFYRNGERGNYSTSTMAFAWFVWEHGYMGEPTIKWI
ncbi:MAG: hypothetical protein EOO77_19745 [Oxalobacteraceae bacterium]|nr:MAG: hypothetical protein EOO77_19745 [Oxalobacteraceae bacterium]